MKRAALLVVVVGGGCWSGGDVATTAPSAAATLPPHLVDGHDRLVVTRGLPAVARDGSLVVLASQPGDSARGNPALTLVALRRDDTPGGDHLVLDPNIVLEGEARREAFTGGNAWLADLHANHAFVPLAELPTDGSVAITWSGETRDLAIAIDHVTEVATNTPARWLVEPYPAYKGSPDLCENPAHLEHAWLARAQKLALLEIAYTGTDTCWEPPARYHVVAW